MLCINHQFFAPSLYNHITQLIFITDIFRPKIKIINVQRFLAACFVCARSVVFCQNFWQITQRLPGNWKGGWKRFSGAFRAGALSPLACLLLARPFFLVPTTSKCLLRRLPFHLMHALSILKLSSLMPNEKRFMEIVKFIVKSTCICMTVENTVLCVLKLFM